MLRVALLAVVLCLPLAAGDAPQDPPQVPPELTPKGEHALFKVRADGEQTYSAIEKNGKLEWSDPVPSATLWDYATAENVGHHGAGPVWEDKDGSKVTKDATAVVKHASPNPTAIPWLLVSVKGEGSGRLAKVTHVQRMDTWGGSKPQSPPAKADEKRTVHYHATYVFLVPD